MPVTLPEWIEGVVFIEEDGAKRILWDFPKRQHLRWIPGCGSGSPHTHLYTHAFEKVCSLRKGKDP